MRDFRWSVNRSDVQVRCVVLWSDLVHARRWRVPAFFASTNGEVTHLPPVVVSPRPWKQISAYFFRPPRAFVNDSIQSHPQRISRFRASSCVDWVKHQWDKSENFVFPDFWTEAPAFVTCKSSPIEKGAIKIAQLAFRPVKRRIDEALSNSKNLPIQGGCLDLR